MSTWFIENQVVRKPWIYLNNLRAKEMFNFKIYNFKIYWNIHIPYSSNSSNLSFCCSGLVCLFIHPHLFVWIFMLRAYISLESYENFFETWVEACVPPEKICTCFSQVFRSPVNLGLLYITILCWWYFSLCSTQG